ncbi:MAG: molybdopterin oxidoreductase family protein [Gammaproteobacteria bacterium]|jgi:anaerobic selenocysteine-containing dehydrogenase
MSAAEHTHYRTCHLCEAICGVEIRVRGTEILSIRGDERDPFSRGHICPKALGLKDFHEDPDRLRRPMRRTASGWEEVSWEAALDEVARRIVAVQREHGADAVATYIGNPQVHNYSGLLGGVRFLRALRSRNRYSATSVDQLPHHLSAFLLYGHQMLIPVPDIDRTQFFLVLGGNPVVSNGSLMTAPDVTRRLKDLRARGGRLVVVDPRRTQTAALADTHLFVTPGSDALLLLSMLQVLFAEGRVALGALAGFIDGVETIGDLVRPFTPESTAAATGIDAEAVKRLVRDFAASPSAACYGRMGVSTQQFGALCQWLIQLLNILTGNLDRVGGAMFTRPAFDIVGLGGSFGQPGSFGKRRTRVRGLPEFGSEFPVTALAEEILTPGKGRIRALVTSAGNPVLSTPNGRRLEEALAQLDFMVSIDPYLNETTRHAHLILPPTSGLERDHFDLVFHVLAVRNTVKYSKPLFAKPPGALHDWEIFHRLAERIGEHDPVRRPGWVARLTSRWLTPKRSVALGIRLGSRGAGWNPFSRGLTLSKVAAHPHGLDLGPLEPCLPQRLKTPDRRIGLAPQALVADLQRLSRAVQLSVPTTAAATGDSPETGVLRLIGRRDPRTNNSWLHNSRRFVKGPQRCTLLMHPADAAARGLAEGDVATVTSRAGSVDIAVEPSDEMMRGVVSIPHGWGHHRPGMRLQVAAAHAGVSANDLTDETFIDELSGNAALNGVAVTIARR